MHTQLTHITASEKATLSLGVMLRRVAEGKMNFEAALQSPFASYFQRIEALNIPIAQNKAVFMFFLSKVVRLSLPLKLEQFIPIFYEFIPFLRANTVYSNLKLKGNPSFTLSQQMSYLFPIYPYLLERLRYFERHKRAPQQAKTWEFILQTALSIYSKYENRKVETWFDYIAYLSVGRSLDALPKAVLLKISHSFFYNHNFESHRSLINPQEMPTTWKKVKFNRAITFYLSHFSGQAFPAEKLEKLLLNPSFYPNFSLLQQHFEGHEIEKALKYLPSFALTTKLAEEEKAIFIGLAEGKNLLSLAQGDLKLTKKMGHYFTLAPVNTIKNAIKYAFLKASGVSETIINTFLGAYIVPCNQKLWEDFLAIICVKEKQREMQREELAQIQPLMDYMNQAYARNHDYSLKGRTWASLLTAMRAWHAEFRYNRYSVFYEWERSSWELLSIEKEGFIYEILELINSDGLTDESAKMHHCVAGYASSCYNRISRIFSLREYSISAGKKKETKRMATIEVRTNEIVQVRKHHNAFPDVQDTQLINLWLAKNPKLIWRHS